MGLYLYQHHDVCNDIAYQVLEIRYSGASISVLFAQVILTIQLHCIYSHLKESDAIQLGKSLNKRCWKAVSL